MRENRNFDQLLKYQNVSTSEIVRAYHIGP